MITKEILINKDEFKAENIYDYWEEYCNNSKKSISIISPYLDNTVTKLLLSKNHIQNVKKKVFTSIDENYFFEKNKISTLIDCLNNGIQVYHIDNLHAKLLIIDNKFISIGSQNFTSRGTINKETSLISRMSLKSSNFLRIIDTWIDEAEKIDLEYLHKLEVKRKLYKQEIENLKEKLKLEFDKVKKENLIKRNISIERNISILKSKSKTRLKNGSIEISIRNNEESTYYAENGKDLTVWKKSGQIKLARLTYYPFFDLSKKSLTFVRLAKTRISYHESNIVFDHKIGSEYYKIHVECSQEKTDDITLIINLKHNNTSQKNCTFKYIFDGKEFKLIEFKPHKNNTLYDNGYYKLLIYECLKERKLETYNTSPITNFLEAKSYSIEIVDFHSSFLIIAEKVT